MKTFKHYILTRFNLGLYSDNPYKIADPDRWMDHRIKLFNEYCAPSVKSQTCQDFTWIIAFDPETPGKLMNRIEFVENTFITMTQPHLFLREQKPESDWLITSRFDNDDIYKPEFVESIQNEFRERREIIDIDYLGWHKEADRYYSSGRVRANSPFLSVCEPWINPLTALGRPHTYMVDEMPSRKLDVLAIQIIHERNIINKINGLPV